MPRVLESRSAGQCALAPPTDGHPPDYRTIQTFHNHFPNYLPTAFQPRANYRKPQPILNRHSTAFRPRTKQNPPTTLHQPPRPRAAKWTDIRSHSEAPTPIQPFPNRFPTPIWTTPTDTQPREYSNSTANQIQPCRTRSDIHSCQYIYS